MATPKQLRVPEERLRQIRREAQEIAPLNLHDAEMMMPVSQQESYYGMPVLKPPAWKWEIPIYFLVGGAAGAAAVLAAAGNRHGMRYAMVRDARWLAAIGGAISPALLIADLGMPSRFLNMFRVFKPQSPMSVGSWSLMAFSSSSAATALLGEIEQRMALRIPVLPKTAEFTSLISGLVLTTYTGVLIGASAVPVWNENVGLLPVQFAASGLSTAVSILELRGHAAAPLNRLGIGAASVETITGAALELRNTPSAEKLRKGVSGWTMRAAGFLSGPLPLALRVASLFVSKRRREKLRKAAAVSAIVGSLMTRVAWVEVGRSSAKDPNVILEPKA